MRTIKESIHVVLITSVVGTVLCDAPDVNATPVTVDFSFLQTTSYAGLPAGSQVTGSFSFDDAEYGAANTWYFHFENGLPTISVEMDWLGTHWTTANAGLAFVSYGPEGAFDGWILAGSYAPEVCGDARYVCGAYLPTGEPDFQLDASGAHPFFGVGVVPGASETTAAANMTWSVRPSVDVPEPTTLALFSLSLLIMAARRRRGAPTRR
jgi:hypothetical protein